MDSLTIIICFSGSVVHQTEKCEAKLLLIYLIITSATVKGKNGIYNQSFRGRLCETKTSRLFMNIHSAHSWETFSFLTWIPSRNIFLC